MYDRSEPGKRPVSDSIGGTKSDESVPELACPGRKTKWRSEEDETLDAFGHECARDCRERPAERVTDKEWLCAAFARVILAQHSEMASAYSSSPMFSLRGAVGEPFEEVDVQGLSASSSELRSPRELGPKYRAV